MATVKIGNASFVIENVQKEYPTFEKFEKAFKGKIVARNLDLEQVYKIAKGEIQPSSGDETPVEKRKVAGKKEEKKKPGNKKPAKPETPAVPETPDSNEE